MKLTTKTFIKRFGSLLTNILVQQHSTWMPDNCLKMYIAEIDRRCKQRGIDESIKHFKAVHLIATKVAMEREFDPLPFCKSDKDGVPLVIKPMKPYLLGSLVEKRVALSITKLYLALVTQPSTDFSSITSPGTSDWPQLDGRWIKFLALWARKFKTPNLRWNGLWHASTKKGPNGPALVFAHQDLISLSNDKRVLNNLQTWLSLTDNSLLQTIENLRIKWTQEQVDGLHHSRLGLLPEGGGKTRQIAIGDYFTQESLYPIFKWSMSALRQLETDGTYNQSRIVEKTRQAMKDRKPIHCLDLSSATDRFPVSLQEDFLASVIGRDRAKAWRSLLTEREFFHSTGNVEYKVGQPMGILSSWSVFALTHHAIIEYSAVLEGISSFRDYVVLGDDVAIFNTKVSDRYQAIMKEIGVTISQPKSFHWVPSDPNPPSAEIAKRLLLEDGEITPIPWKLASTWANAPVREAITLVVGLRNLGLELEPSTWETLSSCVSKRHRRRFLILSQVPLDLLGSRKMSSALFTGVVGIWNDRDFSRIEEVFAEILIKDLRKKQERIAELHSQLFDDNFWTKFCDRQGRPISLSVLGLGSLSLNQLHPAVVVINNRLEGLWSIDELITKYFDNPEESDLGWADVFQADFSLATTFVEDKRKKAWVQAKLLPLIWESLTPKEGSNIDNC